MNSVFFENFHSASADFPYISCCVENINYLSHIHKEIEIILAVSGTIEITCDNSCFLISENDMCIFMPGEIHSFSSKTESSIHIIKLQCKNSEEIIDFSALLIKNPIDKSSDTYKKVKSLVLLLTQEAQSATPGYGYAVNSMSQQILCQLIRSKQLIPVEKTQKKKHHTYITLLEKTNEYLSKHYGEYISVKEIAAYCNLSPYYFSHIFKEATNTTFYNYLTAYRLDKALPFLLYSDKKMIEICLECGFSNTRSFNRAFRKFFNKTPTEFKENEGLNQVLLPE